MLYLEQGNQFQAEYEAIPGGYWIRAELSPAPGFCRWWWEISVWEKDHHDGKTLWTWAHYWKHDGEARGLGRAIRKAEEAMWRAQDDIEKLKESVAKEMAKDK